MSYQSWLETYKRKAAPAASPRTDAIVIALTSTGTLYVGTPSKGGYLIRRHRPTAPHGERDAFLEGMLASVEPASEEAHTGEGVLVLCRGVLLRVITGSFGLPVIGKRMAAGRTGGRLEVSSPVCMLRLADRSNEAAVESFLAAYMSGDADWMACLDRASRPADARKAA